MAAVGSSSSVDHWLFDHSNLSAVLGGPPLRGYDQPVVSAEYSDTLCSFEGSGEHLRDCEPLVPQIADWAASRTVTRASPNCRREASTPESGSPCVPAKYLENSIASASIVSASCKGHPVDV
jgi:hypothetical protein